MQTGSRPLRKGTWVLVIVCKCLCLYVRAHEMLYMPDGSLNFPLYTLILALPIQYRLATAESQSLQQWKIRHIHGVHSTTCCFHLLISIDLDRPSPNEFLLMKAVWVFYLYQQLMYTNCFSNSTMNMPYFQLFRGVTFPLLRAGTVIALTVHDAYMYIQGNVVLLHCLLVSGERKQDYCTY